MKSFPILPEHEVLVWRGHTRILSDKIETLRGLLTNEERTKAGQFRFEADCARFILARGCLRVILGGHMGISPTAVPLEFTSHGKPQLSGTSPLHFNVSHSGEYFLIALSQYPLGIDIEQHRPRVNLTQLARRFFSEPEWRDLETHNEVDQTAVFYHIWTRKEAFIKGVGQGLSYPLRTFSVLDTQGKVGFVEGLKESHSKSPGWFVQDLVAPEGYSAALATWGGRYNVTLEKVDAFL